MSIINNSNNYINHLLLIFLALSLLVSSVAGDTAVSAAVHDHDHIDDDDDRGMASSLASLSSSHLDGHGCQWQHITPLPSSAHPVLPIQSMKTPSGDSSDSGDNCRIYRLLLQGAGKYEVRVSYPAIMPAIFNISIVNVHTVDDGGGSGRAGFLRRRLLNVQKEEFSVLDDDESSDTRSGGDTEEIQGRTVAAAATAAITKEWYAVVRVQRESKSFDKRIESMPIYYDIGSYCAVTSIVARYLSLMFKFRNSLPPFNCSAVFLIQWYCTIHPKQCSRRWYFSRYRSMR